MSDDLLNTRSTRNHAASPIFKRRRNSFECRSPVSDMTEVLGNKSQKLEGDKPSCSSISAVSDDGSAADFDLLS